MKEFFKDNKVILILILTLGLLLRLWNLNKPEGLWNDEYITYSISMLKFPFDFFDGIKNNCHAPLHYFYLKLWMLIFRDSDFMLRLSSLVPNILGCLVMYHVGKSYQTKNSSTLIGLSCALISAISSFLIYFSQRIKRIIVSSGYNIYPTYIESIINSHDAVLTSTVIGIPHSYKGQVAKAFIVLKNDYKASKQLEKEIKELCAKHVAKYALPVEYEFREKLPVTKVGKVAFRELEKEEKEKNE